MNPDVPMANPWLALPETAPFVLPGDQPLIERSNQRLTDKKRVRLDVLPVPFLGSLDSARVVLLALNPGYKDADRQLFGTDKEYVEQNRRSLAFASSPSFFYLDRRFSETPGYNWWYTRLRQLIEVCGHDTVAARTLCVEFFPYHSEEYGINMLVPSQRYGFWLVKQAVARKKLIVVMRSETLWLRHVPELHSAGYIARKVTKTGLPPRATHLSRVNLSGGDFERIVAAIQG